MQPVIFGCKGPTLAEKERDFFKAADPAGFILFARNIETPDQTRSLVTSLKELVGRDCLILIDQEGGRVARLKEPYWPKTLPVARLCADPALAEERVYTHFRLIAAELKDLGITVCCAPVLDVPITGADPIIGDRAFGTTPEVVSELGRVSVAALQAQGILPVIKHIPGHGKALVDSHLHLPEVLAVRDDLEPDFAPFRALKSAPFAMTAHIAYKGLGVGEPLTFSKSLIGTVIRQDIGFEGLLMTDDLSMQALKGSMQLRAQRAMAAGCDLLLHCNSEMAEMEEVMRGCPAGEPAMADRLNELLDQASQCAPAHTLTDCRKAYQALVNDLERVA